MSERNMPQDDKNNKPELTYEQMLEQIRAATNLALGKRPELTEEQTKQLQKPKRNTVTEPLCLQCGHHEKYHTGPIGPNGFPLCRYNSCNRSNFQKGRASKCKGFNLHPDYNIVEVMKENKEAEMRNIITFKIRGDHEAGYMLQVTFPDGTVYKFSEDGGTFEHKGINYHITGRSRAGLQELSLYEIKKKNMVQLP